LAGDDITGLPAHELVSRGMGYVPQRANVFSSLTVEDNLRMGLYLNMGAWTERSGAINAMFPLLQQRRHQRAGLLSGGERQMLAFGRALMTNPSVLLLDEPSAGLSPIVQDRVFEQVKQIAASGVSVVMVEQNARHCLSIADRGYVLDQGRNAYTGTGQELLNDPKVINLYLGTLGREAS
jgi:branched-chain amino acid transport system ATP-binding protein